MLNNVTLANGLDTPRPTYITGFDYIGSYLFPLLGFSTNRLSITIVGSRIR